MIDGRSNSTSIPASYALIFCSGMLVLFAALSYSAALQKSATFDEPFHALAGWLKLRQGEFQMDYESLPLATEWSAILNPSNAISFDPTNENWTKLPDNPYRGFDLATNTLFRTRGNDGAAFINRGRLMMMLFGPAMAALVIAWAWKIAGPTAGVLAAVLFCLDPNLLGHASLVKTDIAVSLAMAGTIFALWSVGRRLTIKNGVLFGLTIAVAMNVKFSAVLLWPLAVMLLGYRVIQPIPWPVLGKSLTRMRGKLLAAATILVFAVAAMFAVTWAAHDFRFGPSPDPTRTIHTESYRYEIIQQRFRERYPTVASLPAPTTSPASGPAEALSGQIQASQRLLDESAVPPGTRLRLQVFIDRAAMARDAIGNPNAQSPTPRDIEAAEYQLGFVRFFVAQPLDAPDLMTRAGQFLLDYRLLPSAWINGLMVQYSRSKVLDSYLLGQVRHSGTWYFFPLAMLVKSPVATVIALLVAMGCGVWLIKFRWQDRHQWGWSAICVLLPPIAFMAMAMGSHLNIGIRHIFPVYPFMYVAAAIALAKLILRPGATVRRVAIGIGVTLLAETALAWPNYIAHFNFIAREWPGELYLLGDSNLDWGQDLPALRDWQKEHPNKRLALAYFGMAAPEFYGIRYDPLPPWPPAPDFVATHVLAISATDLQGLFDPRYTGYRNLDPPAEVLGRTIYLYYDRPAGR